MKRFIFTFLLSQFVLSSCTWREEKNKEGKELATLYCGTCHQVPLPEQLDKKTWLFGVLPKMGPRLGIYSFQNFTYEVNRNSPGLPPGFYPDSAVISPDQWSKIMNYFYEEAPDSLALSYSAISKEFDQFEVKTPAIEPGSPPVSSLVKIDEANHRLFVAHGTEMKLKVFDAKLKKTGEAGTITVAVDLSLETNGEMKNRSGLLLNMGALSPFDVTHGSLQRVKVDESGAIEILPGRLMDGIVRPVHVSQADLDGDQKEDLVVCGFGNFTGELFWLKNKGDDHYEKKILRAFPGAIQTMVSDINHDGRPDILALMAQGDEGFFSYEQNPDGTFTEKRRLRFSPVAGSISFDLADFNNDGFPDLIYTSGDNADYSQILKPYHGVYIFVNDGKWNFSQQYFFPINGCFKAIARDFDLDGDADIAAISYFSDFKKRPEESFVYLRNEGGFRFSPLTVKEYGTGRWLTMDAGDLDGDGDCDIVLGNMSIGPSNFAPNPNWRTGPEFILLENKARQPKP